MMTALYLPLGHLFLQIGWVHDINLQFQSFSYNMRGFQGWAWCLQRAEMTSLEMILQKTSPFCHINTFLTLLGFYQTV